MPDLKLVKAEELTPVARLVEEYLVHCRARRLSKRTIDQIYRPVLRRVFLGFCEREGIAEIRQVDKRAMDRFQVQLVDEPGPKGSTLKPASVHSYVRTINSFLAWARKEGETVAIKAELPRLPKRKVLDVLSRDEIQAMEEAADTERDKLIVRMLADYGLRVGELCALTIADLIDRDRSYLRIRGKAEKERLVPITPGFYRRLSRYMSRGRPKDTDSQRLFLSLHRRPSGEYIALQPSGVEQMIRALADKAEIQKRVYPHLFRHSYITYALTKGMNPVVLARVVGHERLDLINSVYSHIASSDASDAVLALLQEE